MLEIIDPLRNAISILESNSQGYHTNRDKIPIRRAQSQTTMSPSTVTIPSIKREKGGGGGGWYRHPWDITVSIKNPLRWIGFIKPFDAIHAPPIAYQRRYVQLTFRDRRYRLGRGRHERWFPRCHIEFHLGIQFRVRMTFFVFLAGRNIAFFRKAFLPSRHGAASHPRWNEIPRPICHRVTRLSFTKGKRSDRVEERKIDVRESSFETRISWDSV